MSTTRRVKTRGTKVRPITRWVSRVRVLWTVVSTVATVSTDTIQKTDGKGGEGGRDGSQRKKDSSEDDDQ